MRFPEYGKHDNAPTPEDIKKIILNLGYIDACTGEHDFLDLNDPYLKQYSKLFCNPPFSKKIKFVHIAVKRAQLLKQKIILYLPFDPTTPWFNELINADAVILVLKRRCGKYGIYPAMLAVLNDLETAFELYTKLDALLVVKSRSQNKKNRAII